MDLDTSPRSRDDAEIDTPPHSSAALKRHHHAPPHAATAVYKECMRNHAATIGGHAVDGCGEFMPSLTVSAGDMRCAACGCHRSFHRREIYGSPTAITPPFLDFRRPQPPKRFSLSPSPPPARAFFTLGPAEEIHPAPVTPTAENPSVQKRFRTRFSPEQKEKMQCFAARLGWRIQKSDEAAVREFCRENGVAKGVLKVWMHNNKHTFGKVCNNGGLISFENVSGGRKLMEEIRNGAGGGFQNESLIGAALAGGRSSSSP